ncbi:uncharacterized protein LOC123306349 [Coccinella septempunctata]|uniref:uncharacterized protein LOC123306349 n=1 Tax=Coccinella septempunctata TaxID=41139 RepID=UPI001D05ED7E|nr:uncharacterized protein LOC123306349 [Coccinella septempunctata]
MLTRDEELRWSTKQCHQVEEDYLCDQDSLDRPPECMKNVLKTHLESCPRRESPSAPNLKTLEDGNILSINNLEIQEKCPQQTKYHFTPPMAIIQSKCIISNNQKEIYPIQVKNEEKYIVLPKPTFLLITPRKKRKKTSTSRMKKFQISS